jgi:hypothetical protein
METHTLSLNRILTAFKITPSCRIRYSKQRSSVHLSTSAYCSSPCNHFPCSALSPASRTPQMEICPEVGIRTDLEELLYSPFTTLDHCLQLPRRLFRHGYVKVHRVVAVSTSTSQTERFILQGGSELALAMLWMLNSVDFAFSPSWHEILGVISLLRR